MATIFRDRRQDTYPDNSIEQIEQPAQIESHEWFEISNTVEQEQHETVSRRDSGKNQENQAW